ncbi:HIT domain-containing protein [Corynebacterium poyangense]|uniref:HIT domain-containing protein n=1 Tax=Corynebacterium poyangense TaxID=2684405 RepID=A0A7H0SQZ9_9CORY|nr:HIT family protein [Corynebacterium poyangense]QNQ90974.1 HIT domain-containing protein [Corynebacterium poyangense]
MSSVFSKIIAGELPGRFVYRDDTVAAFLTIAPVRYGHVLVVPIKEVDKWTDLPASEWLHLCEVAQKIGQAVVEAFQCQRAGTLIAGFEVPHTHIHIFPADDMSGFDLSRAMSPEDTVPAEMDRAAEAIRGVLGTDDQGRS